MTTRDTPVMSRTGSTDGHFDWLSVAALLGGLLLLYYVVPILSLVLNQSPAALIASMTDPTVISAAGTSLVTSLISASLAAVFGLPLAYWMARSGSRAVTPVTALVVLPLVLPPVVSGLILLTVVGPGTLVDSIAQTVGVSLTGSLAGVVLAQTFVASPFVVITATAAFRGVDDRLEQVSRTLGTDRLSTMRRITLPLAWPGILAGITLAFARAMGEFGATIMLAFYPRTMPVEIWVSFSSLGLSSAFPLAVILVGVAVATLLVLNVLGSSLLQ
ncbi:MAG: ABC transporter permease [Salinirussus sp.]